MKIYTLLSALLIVLLVPSCKKKEDPAPPLPVSITLDHEQLTVINNPGYGYRIVATIVNGDAQAKITWKSSDVRIATVDADGIVRTAAAGQTDITATLTNSTLSATCKVTVTNANDYKYRLVLKDKGTSNFSIGKPEDFLSAKAIARRKKRNIAIDASDLPISPDYIKAIQNVGGVIVAQSKWLNTVCVNTSDQLLVEKYKALPFVKDVILVWNGARLASPAPAYTDVPQAGAHPALAKPINYGQAVSNITVNNGQPLHNAGYTGTGIDIAVIDAGFINLKSNPYFSNMTIKGAKSFVYENHDPYNIDNHGVWVTSCMAVNKPGDYVGTAPDANYWLLRSEDESTEFPIEEDYWVNAIEYADSVGVDIVNSSLTYTSYYLPQATYKFTDMDGKTAPASRAANVAFSKGIFIVCCAGNDNTWVGTPADSPNVLTVGGVNPKGTLAAFTSWGVTVDGRTKPDVMANSGLAMVVNPGGFIEDRGGTSYASPIICGLAACLWQAYPQLTNQDLMDIFRQSADRYSTPDVQFGYGIANMQKALDIAKTIAARK